MRAIGTGRRGGSHPGHTKGFTVGFGCAWDKQTGIGTKRNFVAKPHMVKRRLDGQARDDWRFVCSKVGKRYSYRLFVVQGKRQLDIKVKRKTVTIYIDDKLGQYRHNWPEVAIRLIKGAR